MKKAMKKAAYVRPDIVAQAVATFKQQNIQVYGASYEADYQLWHWENVGFTDGSITVDSDIFAMGDKDANSLFIDLFNAESSKGSCKIILRKEAWGRDLFGKNSRNWSHDDFLIFCAICGCDYTERLYRLKDKEIAKFMETYTRAGLTDDQKHNILKSLAHKKYWPPGKNKGGTLADGEDFAAKIYRCRNMWKYAPIIKDKGGIISIAPLNPLPPDTAWEDLIDFDPIAPFLGTDASSLYNLHVWARSMEPLSTLPLPPDPANQSNRLPHGSILDFQKVSPHYIPSSALLLWLYYHGVPHPKGAQRDELVGQIELAIAVDQKIDYDRISLDEQQNTQSYVSFDRILVQSEVVWNDTPEDTISLLRGLVSKIDAAWIDAKFGKGRNGVRNRAWLRFVSGHMDIASLRHAKTTIKGQDGEVTIFEIKVTPSMKSEIYSVYLIFSAEGEYLHDASKCDCPNGWLFCSHMLAFILLVVLVQKMGDWTYDDILYFMPEPIKSMQGIPFAASYVAGLVTKGRAKQRNKSQKRNDRDDDEDSGEKLADRCEAEITKVGKRLAREIPGYSLEEARRPEKDAQEETIEIRNDLNSKMEGKEEKSVNLCERLVKYLSDSDNAKTIASGSTREKAKLKITSEDVNKYNHDLVNSNVSDHRALEQIYRHDCLQSMMQDGMISSDNALYHHLVHFADERETRKEDLEKKLGDGIANIGISDHYEKDFFDTYFDSDSD